MDLPISLGTRGSGNCSRLAVLTWSRDSPERSVKAWVDSGLNQGRRSHEIRIAACLHLKPLYVEDRNDERKF